jgi:hypothetical protein
MCDPLSIAAVSAAGSLVAGGIDYMGQQATVDAQNKANQDWVNYQRAQSQKAAAEDEALRQKAAAAAAQTQAAVNPQTQEAEQQVQEGKLTGDYMSGTLAAPGADPNTALLAGQGGSGSGVSSDITSDIASRVTAAAREAQGRIKALAGLASYGSGYGDVGNLVNTSITTGNQNIALTGDERSGVAKTLGVAQTVPVEQFTQGSNIAGTIASSLANVAGNAFGSGVKSGKISFG